MCNDSVNDIPLDRYKGNWSTIRDFPENRLVLCGAFLFLSGIVPNAILLTYTRTLIPFSNCGGLKSSRMTSLLGVVLSLISYTPDEDICSFILRQKILPYPCYLTQAVT